ncbi:restriction endonuclease [Rhizobiaceae bacterium BDR2-2]|uniref:Restriction endonuclease n=1 Tax=Ectorhizobium quercum TaxID=2965071 RepID=A0AAE3SVF3_9HYPH|nr:restriction endonuclease [Ectorhizobium quercum]MCX8998152.1 restriction endonuclease [Ectorhizobium quercum]
MYLFVFGAGVAAALSWFYGWHHLPVFFAVAVLLPVAVAIVWWWFARLTEAARLANEMRRWHGVAEEHREALALRYRQLVSRNPYGGLEMKPWSKELERFRESTGIAGSPERIAAFDEELTERVKGWACEAEAVSSAGRFRSGDPYEYERWCASQLSRFGWKAEATVSSADQGVDVVAVKGGVKVALQCKLHNSVVGNKAIQEVHAAAAFIDATHAAVVAPSDYTRAARQLAGKLGVLLLHHTQLSKLDELLAGAEKAGALPPDA